MTPERPSDASSSPVGAPRGASQVDSGVRSTWRLDLTSGLLAAGTLAILEMGPALAKKGYNASDFEVAVLTSGQSLGLVLSFVTVHLSRRCARVPLVFTCQLVSSLVLVPVFFLDPNFALPFVLLHSLARIAWSMAIPARVMVYRSNFPNEVRGHLVGRLRQMQLFLTTAFALMLSTVLDWNLGARELVELLGPCPVPAEQMVRYVIPAAASLGLLGSLVYRRIREVREGRGVPSRLPPTATLREFYRVWRRDRSFRRYESFFLLFGFANIMSIPLTQIHAVDELHANYFDLAMINVILVQGLMGLTMPWWGKLVDRHSPLTLRGVLNLVFAIDFLMLFLAPTVGWVFVGRVFRGISMGGGVLIWMLGPLYFARSARTAAVYTGIHTVLAGLRWSLAPFVGVALKNWAGGDSRPIFFLGFVVLVLTGVGMLRESRRESA